MLLPRLPFPSCRLTMIKVAAARVHSGLGQILVHGMFDLILPA